MVDFVQFAYVKPTKEMGNNVSYQWLQITMPLPKTPRIRLQESDDSVCNIISYYIISRSGMI